MGFSQSEFDDILYGKIEVGGMMSLRWGELGRVDRKRAIRGGVEV